MEGVRKYLESSTVHGLIYIATTKKYARLFWILVVIAGFTGAIILIYKSFQSWEESPVATTIETRPITEITFPKVTVCPPKDTYTDLNYHLTKINNISLENDTRDKLVTYALELLNDHLYEALMTKVSLLEYHDRYYNWYHGLTDITIPRSNRKLYATVKTSAISGSIFTQHFGDKFDPAKVYTDIEYNINIYPPRITQKDENATFHFDIEKIVMKDLTIGMDKFWINGAEMINYAEMKHFTKNFTPPLPGRDKLRYIHHTRSDIILPDVRKQHLQLMPGFKVSWFYSGVEAESEAKFNEGVMMIFVRKNLINRNYTNYSPKNDKNIEK